MGRTSSGCRVGGAAAGLALSETALDAERAALLALAAWAIVFLLLGTLLVFDLIVGLFHV